MKYIMKLRFIKDDSTRMTSRETDPRPDEPTGLSGSSAGIIGEEGYYTLSRFIYTYGMYWPERYHPETHPDTYAGSIYHHRNVSTKTVEADRELFIEEMMGIPQSASTNLDVSGNNFGQFISQNTLRKLMASIPHNVTNVDFSGNKLHYFSDKDLAHAFSALPSHVNKITLSITDIEYRTPEALAAIGVSLPFVSEICFVDANGIPVEHAAARQLRQHIASHTRAIIKTIRDVCHFNDEARLIAAYADIISERVIINEYPQRNFTPLEYPRFFISNTDNLEPLGPQQALSADGRVIHYLTTDGKENDIKKSCFSAEIIAAIQRQINTLQREIDSYWPYPNKDKKALKLTGLQVLLEKSTSMNARDAVAEVEAEFSAIREGIFSTRTADLLDQCRNEVNENSAQSLGVQ